MQELGSKVLNAEEQQAFYESDAEEWKRWLANGSVAIVPRRKNGIQRDLIWTAPMRFVRTNKSKKHGQRLATSLLAFQVHRDPHLGLYRTDAPTTSNLAGVVVVALAVLRGWYLHLFDALTAFLSGKASGRTVYVRGPAEGLP